MTLRKVGDKMNTEKKDIKRVRDVDDLIYGENCKAVHSER